jgi:hypothetical protein
MVDTDTDTRNNSPNPSALEDEILRNMSLAITYLTNQVPLGLCVDFAQPSGGMVGEYHPSVPTTYPAPAATPLGNGVANAPLSTFYTNGFAAPGLRRRFKIPILLQHGETFKFSYLLDPGRGPWLGTNKTMDLRTDFWATETFVEKS